MSEITDIFSVKSKGLCSNLPPEVHDKYFTSGGKANNFNSKTAKAICAKCPVREACLAAIVAATGPIRGIVAGHTANEITALRSGRRHEYKYRQYPTRQYRTWGKAPEVLDMPEPSPAEIREIAVTRLSQLTFEERVYLVFRDLKEGRYASMNEAIKEIARIQERGEFAPKKDIPAPPQFRQRGRSAA